jgi:hypothetical protein
VLPSFDADIQAQKIDGESLGNVSFGDFTCLQI